MPQTQSQIWRVGAMVESRSLVIETKRDARSAMKAGSVVSTGVRFEKQKAVGASTMARLKNRLLSSISRWIGILARSWFAGLGTIRNGVEVALPAAKQIPKRRAGVGFAHAGSLVSLRSQMQSMPSLVELAAKIVWPVASLQRAGITRRSTGLPSAAR